MLPLTLHNVLILYTIFHSSIEQDYTQLNRQYYAQRANIMHQCFKKY